ncbi:MAG: hypothetical protein WBG36_04570 [Ornithinimicrobium sp.]
MFTSGVFGPIIRSLRSLEVATRPISAESQAALDQRWTKLPDHVKTAAQTLGRQALGCEGTHGVFPKCNLACTPCYHSRDANQVRVDGPHTRNAVLDQMRLLRSIRGPRAHAQLIGGEVSLLSPDDHAATLQIMREHGREPMSMSHGDFDYDYLRSLAVGGNGQRRFDRLSFAGHFDMMMFGRRGIRRPPDEESLNPFRAEFVARFARLRREHGVRAFLAHNMTVTAANVDQIAAVVRDCGRMGFGLFSFQPAAFVGDERRWRERDGAVTGDQVWAQIERGAGTRLPFRAFQHGDERCNRTTYGFYVGPTYYPILDDATPADLAVRDAFQEHVAGITFGSTAAPLLAGKLLRVITSHPSVLLHFGAWTLRTIAKVGAVNLLRHGVRPVTFVMHSFMDASVVAPAWAALQRGEMLTDPALEEAQQRLQACSYAMAHAETGDLVPACAQHSVLDPIANIELRKQLPLTVLSRAG